jgi:hypothetical protein
MALQAAENGREEHTAGAKAQVYFAGFAARLKSCPDTSGLNLEFFRRVISRAARRSNKGLAFAASI